MLAAAPQAPTTTSAEDADGRAFRTAARLGLTLRMHGGCAQSGMPGSPSAYEVVDGDDRAAAMREAVARAEAVIASGRESLRLQQASTPAEEDADGIALDVCRQVAELPDRNSPEHWPQAMLVTADELHMIVREAIAATPTKEAELRAELARLNAIINTPQADDFLRAVSTEAEHQRQRWPSEHDAGKTPADWFWLVGHLAGKALHAHAAGNAEKAEHHIITTAAALANWHLAVFGMTNMRPGIDSPAGQERDGVNGPPVPEGGA
ncbi:hypothetical protein [Paracidovorax cattleyae]|uniref:hypothetical protein n=1 Tax=Paracidovorax cattleyae TaxID=80868 RepID=UPI001E2AE9FA|nr:hypothetical protein [Paracidovorax cattleyae]